MPRPSLKHQRSREILDAFVTCAARYGLEGATQERIAEEAGVKRTLLRHYLGNRDDMIAALGAHVIARFDQLTDAFGDELRNSSDPSQLIALLFDADSATDPRLVLVFQALTSAVQTNPQLRAPLLISIERFIDLLSAHLQHNFPGRPKPECDAVAHGLAAVFMTMDSLAPLTPPPAWHTAQRHAAAALVATLETTS